jgi:hypothetical protein
MSTETAFSVLYGRRIKNTGDLKDALCAAMADTLAGRITPKEANAINREAGKMLKTLKAALASRKLSYRAS